MTLSGFSDTNEVRVDKINKMNTHAKKTTDKAIIVVAFGSLPALKLKCGLHLSNYLFASMLFFYEIYKMMK